MAGLLAAAALSAAIEVPYLGGYVNDTAGMLSNSVIMELTNVLREHESKTSNQVVVLTIPSLEGESLEEFSMRVVETWKLGRKDRDNGVLLLIVRDDRKLRIEVGNGLEESLTDARANQIIRHEIVPRFKEGDFDGGVRAGVQAILKSLQGTYAAEREEEEERGEIDPVGTAVGLLIFLIVVGTFTAIVVLTKGFQSWFLYFFLMPFWLMFPYAFLGTVVPFIVYVLGAPLLKLFFASRIPERLGWTWVTSAATSSFFSRSSSGGWSSGGSGGFSGGGGSFSGGGSSGSW
jgi:uncharacterized protein